jgi:hypothetical protein
MVKFNTLIIILLLTSITFSQSIKVSVSTDKPVYKIGDYVNYKIEITHNKDIEIFLPSIKDSVKKLEFISQQPVKNTEDNNNVKSTYEFTFIGFDSGGITIPAISIPYKSQKDNSLLQIQTDSLRIFINLINVNLSSEIKDVKEPEKIPLDWRVILLWVLIVIAIAALTYFIYRQIQKRKNKEKFIPEVIKLPHEIALESLKVLDEKKLWQKGYIKEYHTEITEIIRKYFENRFAFPALELTTSEVLFYLTNNNDANDIVNLTNDFLNNADMVKFAKFVPMNNINEEMMRQAVKIVEITIPAVNVKKDVEKNVQV